MIQPIQEKGTDILSVGQIIRGKNIGIQYIIQRSLSTTGDDEKYICQRKGRSVKLVISQNKEHIRKKVHTLQWLKDIKGFSLGAKLLDADQYIAQDQQHYYFYVTEYFQGRSLSPLGKRPEWIYLTTLQLLEQFQYLHDQRFTSGQLKAEQLVLDEASMSIRYQGIVRPIAIGYPLQFSASTYNRSYWGLGSHLADPAEDLFSLTIIILRVFYCKSLPRGNHPTKQLLKGINELPLSKGFKQCLIKAIFGKYSSAAHMQADIFKILTKQWKHGLRAPSNNRQQSPSSLLEINCLMFVALFSLGLSFCLI